MNHAEYRDLFQGVRRLDHWYKVGPLLLMRVIREGAWREYTAGDGTHVRHERFGDFLQTLGVSEETVRRLVAHDPEASEEVDRVLRATGAEGTK